MIVVEHCLANYGRHGEALAMMRKLFALCSVLLAFALSSCIEYHVKISLNKDGSGTLSEETTLGADKVEMMKQMAALGGEEAQDPLAEMGDEEEAKKRAASMGEGVSLSKVEKIEENGRVGVRVGYAFEDINKHKNVFGDSKAEKGEGMTPGGAPEQENEPIPFVYKDGTLSMKNINGDPGEDEGADSGEEAEEEIDEAGMAMAKQMMGDMRMSLKMDFPGGIEKTNASHVEGTTVTFMEMDMGKLLEDPEKFKALSRAKPETPAEMSEALKGIEGVKVETVEEVTITLK